MTRKISWQNVEAQGSSVRSQMEDLGMKRPWYDSIKSPDNRNVNIQETCPDDVKKMLIIWSTVVFDGLDRRHECSELKEGARTYARSTGKQTSEEWTHKHNYMFFSLVVNGSWTQDRQLEMDWLRVSNAERKRKRVSRTV